MPILSLHGVSRRGTRRTHTHSQAHTNGAKKTIALTVKYWSAIETAIRYVRYKTVRLTVVEVLPGQPLLLRAFNAISHALDTAKHKHEFVLYHRRQPRSPSTAP